MAYSGGFVAGVAAGLVARILMTEEPDSVLKRNYEFDPNGKRLW